MSSSMSCADTAPGHTNSDHPEPWTLQPKFMRTLCRKSTLFQVAFEDDVEQMQQAGSHPLQRGPVVDHGAFRNCMFEGRC